MFRMLKLNPPNGWRAVVWELVIVTAGVLIALGVQQWAEDRSWRKRADLARAALKQELGDHYNWSVEWRVVQPCLIKQVDALQDRVLSSGDTLTASPVYSDGNFSFALRMPSKDYNRSVYESAIADGVSAKFDPDFRARLNQHYGIASTMVELTRLNDTAYQEQLILSQPIPLDPSVRFQLLEKLARLRGRIEFMDLLTGQMIDHILHVGMAGNPTATSRETERWGTYQFCKANRLPMRGVAEAMTPVPN